MGFNDSSGMSPAFEISEKMEFQDDDDEDDTPYQKNQKKIKAPESTAFDPSEGDVELLQDDPQAHHRQLRGRRLTCVGMTKVGSPGNRIFHYNEGVKTVTTDWSYYFNCPSGGSPTSCTWHTPAAGTATSTYSMTLSASGGITVDTDTVATTFRDLDIRITCDGVTSNRFELSVDDYCTADDHWGLVQYSQEDKMYDKTPGQHTENWNMANYFTHSPPSSPDTITCNDKNYDNCEFTDYSTATGLCTTSVSGSGPSLTKVGGPGISMTYELKITTSNFYEGYHCLLCWPTKQYNNDYIENGWIYFRVSDNTDCSRQLAFTPIGTAISPIPDNPPSGTAWTVDPNSITSDIYADGPNNYASGGTCSLDKYSFYGTAGYDVASSYAKLQMNAATGRFQVVRDAKVDYYVRIRIEDNTSPGGPYTKNSNWFRVQIVCGPLSNTITDPPGLVNTTGSTTQTQTFYITTPQTRPTFYFPEFTQSQLACPIVDRYYHYSTPGTASGQNPGLQSAVTAASGSRRQVKAASTCNKGSFRFSIAVMHEGESTVGHWATLYGQLGSANDDKQYFWLNVDCDGASTTITEDTGTFLTGCQEINQCASTQWVDTEGTLDSARFLMPNFTQVHTCCPITTFQTSNTNAAVINPGANYMKDPVLHTGVSSSLTKNYHQVQPHDPAAHQKYEFYVKATADGGSNRWSQKYTLIVGCTSDASQQNNNPSFYNSKIVYIPQSVDKIYQFYPPTPFPSYCGIIKYDIVDFTKVQGNNLANVLFDHTGTQSCTGTIGQCQWLDLTTTDHIQKFTFRIATTLRNNVDSTHKSDLITIDVKCRTGSTPVFSTVSNFSALAEQYNTTDRSYWFPPFTCTYMDCCQSMKYHMIKTTTPTIGPDPYSPSAADIFSPEFSSPVMDTNGEYLTVFYTGEITTYMVYVYGVNEWGDYAISPVVNVTIRYNCLFTKIEMNTAAPTTTTEPRAAEYVFRDDYPVLVIDEIIGNITQYSVNITQRIIQNVTAPHCALVAWRILEVQKLPAKAVVASGLHEALFSVGYGTGIFQLDNYGYAYSGFAIFMEAFNSKVWGGAQDSHLVEVTLRAVFALPNLPAFFVEDPQNITIALRVLQYPNGTREADDNRVLTYPLPGTFDATNDSVVISIDNEEDVPFVTVVNGSLVVNTTLLELGDVGRHQVRLLLTDSQGGKREYSVFVTVTAGDIEQKVFPTTDWGKDDGIREPPPVPVLDGYVAAEIDSISRHGLMTILFNETMDTDFDHSVLNQSSVPIFIEPALQRNLSERFRQPQVGLNWTLEKFAGDTMLVQLTFHQPYEISPLAVQDRVFVNFTKVAERLYSSRIGLFPGPRRLQESRATLDIKPLHPDYYVLSKKVVKQLPRTEDQLRWASLTDDLVSFLFATIISAMIIAAVFSQTIWFTLAYIRYLQVCLHLPMMSIPVPANVIQFMRKTLVVPKLDPFRYLWREERHESAFDFPLQETLRSLMPDQTEELGYDTHNALINQSALAVFIMAYAAGVIAYVVGKAVFVRSLNAAKSAIMLEGGGPEPRRKTRCLRFAAATLRFLDALLFYRLILFVFLFGFMEFVISGRYGSIKEAISTSAPGESFQIIFVWLGLSGALIGLPMLYYWLMKASFSYKKFSVLHYAVRAQKSWWIGLFYPLYMLRRLAYVAIVWYFWHPVLQLFGMIAVNYLALVYVGWHGPLLTQLQNRVEYYNQLSIVLVTLHLCTFTDWVPSRQVQAHYGTSMIIVICSHMLISLLITYYWLIRHLCLIILKYLYILNQKLEACAIRRRLKFRLREEPEKVPEAPVFVAEAPVTPAVPLEQPSPAVTMATKAEISEEREERIEPKLAPPAVKVTEDVQRPQGGFSANYLIVQQLNQGRRARRGRGAANKKVVLEDPKRVQTLNMTAIQENIDDESVDSSAPSSLVPTARQQPLHFIVQQPASLQIKKANIPGDLDKTNDNLDASQLNVSMTGEPPKDGHKHSRSGSGKGDDCDQGEYCLDKQMVTLRQGKEDVKAELAKQKALELGKALQKKAERQLRREKSRPPEKKDGTDSVNTPSKPQSVQLSVADTPPQEIILVPATEIKADINSSLEDDLGNTNQDGLKRSGGKKKKKKKRKVVDQINPSLEMQLNDQLNQLSALELTYLPKVNYAKSSLNPAQWKSVEDYHENLWAEGPMYYEFKTEEDKRILEHQGALAINSNIMFNPTQSKMVGFGLEGTKTSTAGFGHNPAFKQQNSQKMSSSVHSSAAQSVVNVRDEQPQSLTQLQLRRPTVQGNLIAEAPIQNESSPMTPSRFGPAKKKTMKKQKTMRKQKTIGPDGKPVPGQEDGDSSSEFEMEGPFYYNFDNSQDQKPQNREEDELLRKLR